MKIKPETIEEARRTIPENKRVFIYNADIILEFLNKTFTPLPYFVKAGEDGRDGLKALQIGADLVPEHFKEGMYERYSMPLDKIYELYKVYREGADYTMPIETKAKFGLILNRLNYRSNGWQFIKRRLTRKQYVAFTPLKYRGELLAEEAAQFPLQPVALAQSEVDLNINENEDVRSTTQEN